MLLRGDDLDALRFFCAGVLQLQPQDKKARKIRGSPASADFFDWSVLCLCRTGKRG